MIWEIESFTPSDGTKYQHVPADHTAWLRGRPNGDDGRTVNISMNIASVGFSQQQARDALERMVRGLNTAV
jgi:hypothetical protein